MANYTNSLVRNFVAAQDTFPDPIQILTGSLVTNGVFVTGTGTLFLSEIGGDSGLEQPSILFGRGWIVDLLSGNLEIRRITQVVDDTHLVLDKPFTTDILGDSVFYVPMSRAMYIHLYVGNGASVNGIVNNSGEIFEMEFGSKSEANVCVDPVLIDTFFGDPVMGTAFFFH